MYAHQVDHKESHNGSPLQGATPGIDSLPTPLDHILSQVFGIYEARTPEALVALMKERYRDDATFIDPTLMARPWRAVALQFYALQHLFTRVSISDIAPPEVHHAPQPKGPDMLQVIIKSKQDYEWSRRMHISQQILPEVTSLRATTRLLIDPATGRVVRHEDTWDDKKLPVTLPLALRRVNSLITHGVYRLLGWRRVIAQAEAKCSGAEGPNGSLPAGAKVWSKTD